MANVKTGNPWVLDTVETLTTDNKRLRQVHWRGGTGSAELQDGNGVYIWGEDWPSNSVQFPLGMAVNGLILATLGGGTLYLYFEKKPRLL